MQQRLPMVCLSEYKIRIISFFIILSSFLLVSCVSFRIIKINNGTDILHPAKLIHKGKTGLSDILSVYGAPCKIIEVDGKTVIIYEKSYYKGAQLSIGIPLSEITGANLSMTAFGNLLRYDTLMATFDDNYILIDIAYERGTDQPFWTSLYKD